MIDVLKRGVANDVSGTQCGDETKLKGKRKALPYQPTVSWQEDGVYQSAPIIREIIYSIKEAICQ